MLGICNCLHFQHCCISASNVKIVWEVNVRNRGVKSEQTLFCKQFAFVSLRSKLTVLKVHPFIESRSNCVETSSSVFTNWIMRHVLKACGKVKLNQFLTVVCCTFRVGSVSPQFWLLFLHQTLKIWLYAGLSYLRLMCTASGLYVRFSWRWVGRYRPYGEGLYLPTMINPWLQQDVKLCFKKWKTCTWLIVTKFCKGSKLVGFTGSLSGCLMLHAWSSCVSRLCGRQWARQLTWNKAADVMCRAIIGLRGMCQMQHSILHHPISVDKFLLFAELFATNHCVANDLTFLIIKAEQLWTSSHKQNGIYFT